MWLDLLEREPTQIPTCEADQAMLRYAMKLNQAPQSMTSDDIELLRQNGFSDHGIHEICAVTAYFAFANRIADGLGIQLEQP